MNPYTVIDSDDYKAAGIEAFFFSGGEPHIKLPEVLPDNILFFLKLRTWNDVGLVACLRDALRRRPMMPRNRAFIPYFPGGRQDRSDGYTPLTAELMLDLLGKRQLVSMFDPHSDFTEICARDVLMPADLKPTLPFYDGVIAPDAGAADRALSLAHYCDPSVPIVQCEKVREFGTGRITSYKMPKLPKPGRYLIVDDICDGGATFNMLAHEFFKDQCSDVSELDLWVSHGIFSKGVDNLDHRIGHIYTTDSWYNGPQFNGDNTKRLTVFPLSPLFDRIMES